MKVIDSDNYAASGIETFFFPGGEPHARIPLDFGDALLFLKARTWNDLGTAVCVLDALDWQYSDIWLFAPYFPGARQDRTDGQTPWTVNIMGNLIAPYADRAYTFDVHSELTTAIIESSEGRNFMPSDLPAASLPTGITHIIAPDEGARARAQDFSSILGDLPIIYCDKKRDFASGKFMGFHMPTLPAVGTYLIVDDICDGGGTFNLLAEEFDKDPNGQKSKLELWVSHGIFSKGVRSLHPTISKIHTTDSWCKASHTHESGLKLLGLTVNSLQPIIDQILAERK